MPTWPVRSRLGRKTRNRGQRLTEQDKSRRGDATPFWFGPEDRALFGWLHLPADRVVHGGVVLCQPLGIEATCTYFSLRLLAEELTARGVAVLRFDYDGTGDSCGEESDPDRVAAWLSSLSMATDTLLTIGVTRLGLVGIRMGGLFAGYEAARRGGVSALVLWDACLSGASFLREQRFLRILSGTDGDPEDAAVEAPGLRLEPATVNALSDLDLTHTEGHLADQTLVLTPQDLSRARRLERRLEGDCVVWQEATGQDQLLDSSRQTPPLDTIVRTADWLADALDGDRVQVAAPPSARSALVVQTDSGVAIVERTVQLGSLGLFGIVTEPAGGAEGSTVVLVNEGNTHHIGQARIWVDLARRLAPSGFRILRFDLSGNGDSGTRPGQLTHVARAPEAIDDVYEAMRGISPRDPTDVVLVGFCSGAYQVLEQTLVHPPRGICVINPSFTFAPPESASHFRPARQYTKRWLVHLIGPPLRRLLRDRNPPEATRWARALDVGTWPVALAKRHPGWPAAIWWVVNRLLLVNPAIGTLERIVDSGVDTHLVCGPGDLLPVSLGSEARMRRLGTSHRFHIDLMDELDHASWVKRQREALIKVIVDRLAATCGDSAVRSDRSTERRMSTI